MSEAASGSMPEVRKPGIDPDLAVRSFFSDSDWGRKTAVGATFIALSVVLASFQIMLLPLVFILWALVVGYLMRVTRTKIADPKAKLPDWREWVDLLISGLTWLAAYTGFCFLLLSIPTVSLMIGGAQGAVFAPDPRFLPWAITTFTLTCVVSLFVGLISTYLQANLAQEERTTAAFDLIIVIRRLGKSGGPMVQAWLLSTGLIGASIILPACTLLGICLIPTFLFMASNICAILIAQAWTIAGDADPKPAPKAVAST